ncbi:MAG: MATE family efflux transporter [Steroidobacteraceae bacterium]|nr:MATE family efflux transporter [Steroidobacteraceae bacterium]
MAADNPRLPARRLDAHGVAHVDGRAILALAVPLVINSLLQSLLGLTDTWFIGQLSTEAMAAMGAIYFLVLVFVIFFAGVSFAVQTLVAQAYGAGRYRRASKAVWSGLYASLATLPMFALVALGGRTLLSPFGLPADVEALAIAFWEPRLLGGPLAAALWAVLGFFNGIGQTRVTLAVTAVVAVANVFFNQWLIFDLGLGIAGSAWATNIAQAIGLVLSMAAFVVHEPRKYRPLQTLRPRLREVWRNFRLGIPMALMGTVDLGAGALFQLMQVRVGVVEGAASQIAMMLTSLAYSPGYGLAMVGTTLVGQSIGAGDRDWAAKLGNRMILICMCFMGGVGFAIALAGPWLVPLFVSAGDPAAPRVVSLALTLLWIGACYQLFDGLNFSSGAALRGAGDATLPSALVLALAVGLLLPLTHVLTFAPGQGWIDALPALGYGAPGGWVALIAYVVALGLALFARWHSGAWRRIRLG